MVCVFWGLIGLDIDGLKWSWCLNYLIVYNFID